MSSKKKKKFSANLNTQKSLYDYFICSFISEFMYVSETTDRKNMKKIEKKVLHSHRILFKLSADTSYQTFFVRDSLILCMHMEL